MKNKAKIMAMMAAAMMSAEGGGFVGRPKKTPEEIAAEEAATKQRVKDNLIKKGVQYFTIDGYTVIARDHKNAVRKVNNLKSKASGI